MLSYRQRLTTGLCTAVAGLLIWACAWWGPRPVPQFSLAPTRVQFDGAAALEYTRVVAEEFPDRVTGTPAARRAAEYLRAEFRKLDYQVTSPTFSMWLGGERVQGENVLARLDGEWPESVAVIAHYDSQFTSHQAAEDNASGVGVLLELARVLRQSPHRRGLIFAATDAEEWGMIGARELTRFLKPRHIVAVVSIDYLTAGPARALEMNCMGQFAGYTPLWLRQLMVASGRAQSVRLEQATGPWEWIERALEVSAQDQGPLLRAGIPALNLATQSPQIEAVRARYHTPADIFRNFDPAALQMLGGTVEQAVKALDTLPLPAPGTANDFQVSPHRYLPGAIVRWMQFLGLLPIVLAAVFAARNLATEKIELRGWRFFEPASWVIPPCLAALLLYALTELDVLPRYELYPATPKDPFLYHLPLTLIAALVIVTAVGFVELQKLRSRVHTPPTPFEVKKRLLFLWVVSVTLVAFFDNPYAMWLFLGGFAYATLLLVPPRSALSRTVNAALLIASAAPFAALLYSFGREIYLGWRIVWYLVLQAAYGVWSPVAVALFLLAVVLAAQLFWISVLQRHGGAGLPSA
jgi:hypothetical protein